MNRRPRLLLYCQHFFGIGHLVRSLALADELAKDFALLVVHGGEPIEELRPSCATVYLPPIRVFPGLPRLRPVAQNLEINDVLLERKSLLVALPTSFKPDVVVIESYPFGRAELSGELLPFLGVCKQLQIAVACSVRDIVARTQDQAEHNRAVRAVLNEYFDAVLVHSDPQVSTLSDTFSDLPSVEIPVYHTGYVLRHRSACQQNSYCLALSQSIAPLIIVSAGGGRAGKRLLDGAIEAARLLRDRLPHRFSVHPGPFASPDDINDLRRRAKGLLNVTIAPFITCLSAHFRTSALSISMGGYNTMIELLSTETPALVWPHDQYANEDQRLRCQAFAGLGAIGVLSEHEAEGTALARRILERLDGPQQIRSFDYGGASASRKVLLDLARANMQ